MKISFVFVLSLILLSAGTLYAQRVLVPLSLFQPDFTAERAAQYWVDTLGSGFMIGGTDYRPILERLHTTRVQTVRIRVDIVDLSQTLTIGDTIRRTMFLPSYRHVCDSLLSVVGQYGGGLVTLQSYTNDDSTINTSRWNLQFNDTIPIKKLKKSIEGLFTDSSGLSYMNLHYTDPFVEVTSVGSMSDSQGDIRLYPHPAEHSVTVEMEGIIGSRSLRIEILSISGERVKEQQIEMIEDKTKDVVRGIVSLSDIPAGVYILRCGNYSTVLQVLR